MMPKMELASHASRVIDLPEVLAAVSVAAPRHEPRALSTLPPAHWSPCAEPGSLELVGAASVLGGSPHQDREGLVPGFAVELRLLPGSKKPAGFPQHPRRQGEIFVARGRITLTGPTGDPSAPPQRSIEKAAAGLVRRRFRRLPILDEGVHFVGALSIRDLHPAVAWGRWARAFATGSTDWQAPVPMALFPHGRAS